MIVNEIRDDRVTILELTGRLDGTTTGQIEARLQSSVDTSPVVIIDLAALDYISSAGLRVLLSAAKKAKATGHSLVLAGPQESVAKVFEMTGFADFCPIYQSRANALEKIN